MNRRTRKVLFGAAAYVALVASCGSRTGLLTASICPPSDPTCEPEFPDVIQTDSTLLDGDADDAEVDTSIPFDAPIFEGGKLDVVTDCGQPPYCDPRDLEYIYQCGVRIERCGSLEQCSAIGSESQTVRCANPCVDTLGQNTSNGCEFWAIEPDSTSEAAGSCFAAFVVNQWFSGEPARIQVERDGRILPIEQFARIPVGNGVNISYTPYSERAGLAKDQIAILFLSRDPAAVNDPRDPANAPRRLAGCPAGVTPAVVGDAATHGTGRGRGFRIRTNVPVVAYQMLPYGGGRARVTGATLLLPTNVWDTNYVAANAFAAPLPSMINDPAAGPTLAVVAQDDDTEVRIRPTTPIVGGGGLAGGPANVTQTYRLSRGEYLQFVQKTELSGSPIQANKPVAVVGGATLMNIPLDRRRADGAHQMLPPVRALGNEYVAVRYRSRETGEESVPWRIVGAVDGTRFTYEPQPPAGAPLGINAREVVEFQSPGPFVVRSQGATHPFYLASYMTGGEPYDGTGDPEFVNVVPPAQYLPRYVFFTDPTYPETNLVVVRVRDAQTGLFPDVTLDCAGLLGGWQSVGLGGRFQFTRIDLSSGDFVGQNGCNNGVHAISAVFPGDAGARVPSFGVTIWGWGNPATWPPDNTAEDEANPRFSRWVSYGYPAGADFLRLNNVSVPAN